MHALGSHCTRTEWYFERRFVAIGRDKMLYSQKADCYFLLHVTNCPFHLFHWALEHTFREWFFNQRPLCYNFNRIILLRNLCWFRNAPISLSSAERKLNCLGKQKYAVWPMVFLCIGTISVISNLIFRGILTSIVLSGQIIENGVAILWIAIWVAILFVSECNVFMVKPIGLSHVSFMVECISENISTNCWVANRRLLKVQLLLRHTSICTKCRITGYWWVNVIILYQMYDSLISFC